MDNGILAAVKKMDPSKAAVLENAANKKGAVDLEATNKAIDRAFQGMEPSDKTVGDLLGEVSNIDKKAPPRVTIHDAVTGNDRTDEEKIDERKSELNSILSEIKSSNFVDPQYIDYFQLVSFDKKLELLEVSKDQAAFLCDDLVTKGYIIKKVKFRSIEVKLVSREMALYLNSIERLDEMKRTSQLRYMEFLTLYNCAGSLLKYGETEFAMFRDVPDNDQEKYLNDKIKFIKRLPAAIYGIVMRETAKLDLLTNTIMSEEGLTNF